MAGITRVRVEVKNNWIYPDRDKTFKLLLKAFTKSCNDAGIGHMIKEHEFFESKSRKQRKKKRQSKIKAIQEDLKRRYFSGEKIPGYKPKLSKNSDKSFDY